MTADARPKRVVVGVYTYAITYHPDDEMGEDLGATNNTLLRIKINNEIVPAVQKTTLFHEIMHAIWWTSGLTLPADGATTESVEEAIINAQDDLYVLVLKSNPKVMAWILSD